MRDKQTPIVQPGRLASPPPAATSLTMAGPAAAHATRRSGAQPRCGA